MHPIHQVAFCLLLLPSTGLADAATTADVTSGNPFEANEALRFRAQIFAAAYSPNSLWHLASNVLCPDEGSAASIKQHLPSSVRYIDEIFDTHGKIIRGTRAVSSAEAASIVTASTNSDYGELTIQHGRRARLQLNNFVCAMDMHAEIRDGRWMVREMATQCE